MSVPLAYIQEALEYAVANGWRPPTEPEPAVEPAAVDYYDAEPWRSAETQPAGPGLAETLPAAPDFGEVEGTLYDVVQLRHGLSSKLLLTEVES